MDKMIELRGLGGQKTHLHVRSEEGESAARQMAVGSIVLEVEAGAASAAGVLLAAQVPELVVALQAAAGVSTGGASAQVDGRSPRAIPVSKPRK